MNDLNCDIQHIVQALEKLKDSDEYDRLRIWDTGAIMRGIPYEEMKERNLLEFSESVATIEYDITYSFKFHESQVDSSFKWRGSSRNSTKPKEMGKNLRKIVMELEREYEILWDFVEMSAASIGHDGFCDFEFEFEFILM